MTSNFIRLAPHNALQPGTMKCMEVAGQRVLLANVEGRYYAVDEFCTHEDAPLVLGALQGGRVKCSLHGSRFNLADGKVLDEPADEDLRTYPLKIENDTIWIDLGVNSKMEPNV